MNKVQTDNSNLSIKIKLRNENLPSKKIINVLDVFSGEGEIWREIKKLNFLKTINVTRIDKRKKLQGMYLIGENVKFLATIDLSKYDVIDFDSYGFPDKQIEVCCKRIPIGTILFFTVIQSLYGDLPYNLLMASGISKRMYQKIPSIFNTNKADKIVFNYLWCKGLRNVIIYYGKNDNRKRYIFGKKEWEGV